MNTQFHGPTRTIHELLFAFKRGDWQNRHNFWRSAVWGWVLFIALVSSLTIVLNADWEMLPSNLVEDGIAVNDIRSDRAYIIVDQAATADLKDKARAKVLPVFRFNKGHHNVVLNKIHDTFSNVRQGLAKLKAEAKLRNEEVQPQEIETLRTTFTDDLGVSHSVRDFQVLVDQDLSRPLEEALSAVVGRSLNHPIVENAAALKSYKEAGISLITVNGEKQTEKEVPGKSLNSIRNLEDVRGHLKIAVTSPGINQDVASSLKILAQELILPTATHDEDLTNERLLGAEGEIEDVIIRIQPGESIIRAGDRFDLRVISIVEGIKKAKAKRNFRWKFVGTGIFVFIFLLSFYVFAARFLQRFRPTRKDLIFLGAALILSIGIFRFGITIATLLSAALPFSIPTSAFYYALPIAGVVMVVRLVRNAQEAFVFAAVSAMLIGLAPDVQYSFVVYFLLSGLVAAGSLTKADTRSAIWRAGVLTGAFQMLLVVSFELIRSVEIMVSLTVETQLWNLGLALLGGLLSAIAALGFAALAESVFGYLTDIKLLEMSSLNHPLLRELIVRAPGTYHHSHLVGILAESGCQAIGANGLFARVASYFHDIGKMTKSDYFIENQGGGENRHDNLSPSMSSLIIQNHVKDGIELAKKAKVPQQIIDIIPQHQGTKLVRFFYSKAKEQEDPDVSPVSEKDYRYPGPKPQTREAGVILLADGVEAATRALTDKTPTKIRGVVEKMINNNFTDGQFDDCELTLKDLHDTADAFTNILVAIYHQRIEYPDLPVKEKGRARQGGHEKQDQYSKPQPIADTTAQETPSVINHPTRESRKR